MNKPYDIKSKNLLIIPDWHQDLAWIKSILEKERGNYDSIISLGDEFDSWYKPPKVATVKDTAQFIIELQSGKYGPYYSILGNHTLTYLETYKYTSQYHIPKFIFNPCSGYTNNKSKKIAKILKPEHWESFKIFYFCNGFLISHAGFAQNFWNYYISKEENLDKLWDKSNEAKKLVSLQPDPLFAAGASRGGRELIGGPLWLDWDDEFIDFVDAPPQIVGHTRKYNLIRKKGRSYCLDGNQSTYAILHDDGQLELKTMLDHYAYAEDGKTLIF